MPRLACLSLVLALAAAPSAAQASVDVSPYIPLGFSEIEFSGFDNVPERAIVERDIVAPIAAALGRSEPIGSTMALVDVTNDGLPELFVTLNDLETCDDGCRTLVYRHVDGYWERIADGKAVAVVAGWNRVVFLRANAEPQVWGVDCETGEVTTDLPDPLTVPDEALDRPPVR